ncbi:MATH domain-containing protein At5g43560 [Arabidopsis lyrata subsp. lyrata]|uniref:MATH domain-containing protein At5g43560 n=1 Tax=Arabidopsis lyrata subsp. lyrata TaxID=81972 RepID=UPI000A29BCC5|nr:MATH domain-containing protein At5g43560 [Arabidopsis lyrata subsp. lyrata]|eukprot:XP_020884669.1 MATH domain-containing protein At5g43560 [Arabidopsis lyrata subsp. lyrata]
MSSTTVQSLRERSPSSYSLKIKNFSQLENLALGSADGKYLSRLFSAGGYNWRMILYPKGNDKDNGNVESKPFNTFRSVWGLPQVLPLSTFKDPENGYVCLGQCEFGVDVIVAPPPTNWEILSFDEKHVYPYKISWPVKNIFEILGHCHTSQRFSVGGKTWAIELYPKGSRTADYNKWVSIFLTAADCETLKEDEKIFTQAYLRILDPRGSNHLSRSITKCYNKSNSSWGYFRFVSIDELRNTYLDMEGVLTLEIQFDVVSTTKHSLP